MNGTNKKNELQVGTPVRIGDLTLAIPMIQGGMGVGVSLSGLAGAVASCGAMGVISTAQIGFQEPDFEKAPLEANLRAIEKQISRAKDIVREKACGIGGAVAVNIMVATKYYEKYVEAALKAGADAIISGAGLPVDLPKLAEGFQTKLAPIVSTLKAARVIFRLWEKKYDRVPDFLVIEGPLAGGHLGFTADALEDYAKEEGCMAESGSYGKEVSQIIAYVREVEERRFCKIPVFTAGGIFSREDVRAQLELGADGVQVATRFVTTEECDAHDHYKRAYLKAGKEKVQIMKSPVGMPGRALENEFLHRTKAGRIPPQSCKQCIKNCDPASTPYCITDALIRAVQGDVDGGLVFCGANVYKNERIEKVSEIIDELFIKS